MNKRQKKRLLYLLSNMSYRQAFFHLIGMYVISNMGFLRGWVFEDRRKVRMFVVNDRRGYSPRTIYIVTYAFIIYTVLATVILIASQNLKNGVLFFSAFSIPLAFMFLKTKKRKVWFY